MTELEARLSQALQRIARQEVRPRKGGLVEYIDYETLQRIARIALREAGIAVEESQYGH